MRWPGVILVGKVVVHRSGFWAGTLRQSTIYLPVLFVVREQRGNVCHRFLLAALRRWRHNTAFTLFLISLSPIFRTEVYPS